MSSTPEQIGGAIREHLSASDAVYVASAMLRHAETFAVLISAEGGGETMSGPELAALFLRIAKRLDAEGGQPS